MHMMDQDCVATRTKYSIPWVPLFCIYISPPVENLYPRQQHLRRGSCASNKAHEMLGFAVE
jgi:hypothetical protein